MKKSVILLTVGVFVMLLFYVFIYTDENKKQLISGAGPSTKIVKLFVHELVKLSEVKGYKFNVPDSSEKHAGGIKNTNKFLFGRTGRPLNYKEKSLNKSEIFLGRIPIAFAVGYGVEIKSLTIEQLEGIYTGKIINWKEVGGPDSAINLIGREQTEALFLVLKEKYPFFKKAIFHLVVKKDTHVTNILKEVKGKYSIGFGAKPNFIDINIIHVEGFSAGVSLGLVYDLKNKNNRIVKAAIDFANSSEWFEILKKSPYIKH